MQVLLQRLPPACTPVLPVNFKITQSSKRKMNTMIHGLMHTHINMTASPNRARCCKAQHTASGQQKSPTFTTGHCQCHHPMQLLRLYSIPLLRHTQLQCCAKRFETFPDGATLMIADNAFTSYAAFAGLPNLYPKAPVFTPAFPHYCRSAAIAQFTRAYFEHSDLS
jgi:hypothetical protein